MRIQFTKHAQARMDERGLTKKMIADAISQPEKFHASSKDTNRFIIKKIHRRERKNHLLMIVFEKTVDVILVITVIDTSKIDKYY